jgi:hypothetical protein
MTRQIKEDPAVSEGDRKAARTRDVESFGGEKGVPVNQQVEQLGLLSETAENPTAAVARGAVGGADLRSSGPATYAVLKSENKDEMAKPATMKDSSPRLSSCWSRDRARS